MVFNPAFGSCSILNRSAITMKMSVYSSIWLMLPVLNRYKAGAYSSRQSTGSRPALDNNSLVFEKWRQPKKPLSALKGEGWAAFRI